MSVRILIGDCRVRMAELPDASVDSVVCDPPYHLTTNKKGGSGVASVNLDNPYGRARIGTGNGAGGFMGMQWDGGDVAFQPETWAEVLRVLKPGGHLIAFSGTRTYHRMVCAIEDAGFEIRDQLAWIYGSGFPKSRNLGDGWGTALKPAWEPIALCRKPPVGTNAANMAKHGVGGLNIDGCRIEAASEIIALSGEKVTTACHQGYKRPGASMFNTGKTKERGGPANERGRWPANIVHDGSDQVLAGFPSETGKSSGTNTGKTNLVYGEYAGLGGGEAGYLDSGSAARFFYCAKAASDERGEGNNHPTVKPVALMRWLCRLVTPKGGTVMDPFMGSGTTGVAADAEQFNFIGCEMSPEYVAIAERRIGDAAGMFSDVEVRAA